MCNGSDQTLEYTANSKYVTAEAVVAFNHPLDLCLCFAYDFITYDEIKREEVTTAAAREKENDRRYHEGEVVGVTQKVKTTVIKTWWRK